MLPLLSVGGAKHVPDGDAPVDARAPPPGKDLPPAPRLSAWRRSWPLGLLQFAQETARRVARRPPLFRLPAGASPLGGSRFLSAPGPPGAPSIGGVLAPS